MTEDIVSVARVRVHERCPKCHSTHLSRAATQESTTLWVLTVSCKMCTWSDEVSNVKLGV